MKTIFLESHHLKNLFFGFGQFNLHLIKSLQLVKPEDYRFILHGDDISALKKEFGSDFGYKKYYSLRRYPAFRIRKKYDLWHSLNQNSKIEPHGSLPYLLTVHNIPLVNDRNNFMHLPEHRKFQDKLDRSSAITYISNFAKQSTHEYYQVPNVPEYVIYNGNPITEISIPANFRPKTVPNRPFLFTIGEVTSRKNFVSLVEMMLFLPDLELIIAGKNNTKNAEEITALAEKNNLTDRIHLVGKIGDIERQYYYQSCYAFVFPSLREGFGLPVIEAMRFGKPVFISDKTSLPEVGGDLANYWRNFDPKNMADVIEKGMTIYESDQAALSEQLISRSQEFSWESAAKQYIGVYQQLLK